MHYLHFALDMDADFNRKKCNTLSAMIFSPSTISSLFMVIFVGLFYKAESSCISNRSQNIPLNSENATHILNRLLTGYRKEIIPSQAGKPLILTADMYIADMVPIDNLHMHFSADFYLRLKWRDYRLQYKDYVDSSAMNNIPLDEEMLKQIWFPNVYFPYEKKGYTHTVLKDNVLVWLGQNGTVLVSKRLSLTSFCSMDLAFYPFDIQQCKMNIETYSYPRPYLRLIWSSDDPVKREENMHMKDFSQVVISASNSTVEYHPFGCFDRLTVNLSLYRFLGLFFLRDFFPCILVVILSWVSFWINFRSTPARISLGITTVLTVVTLTNGIRANSPPAGLFRSLDYYLLMCNIYVFAALGEFALVGMTEANWQNKKKQKNSRKKKSNCFKRRGTKKGHGAENGVATINGHVNHMTTGDNNVSFGIHSSEIPSLPPGSERVMTSREEILRQRRNKEEVDDIIQVVPIGNGANCRPHTAVVSSKRGIRFIDVETHVIDKISRVLFPTTFLLCNAIYFIFHRLHPDTVDS